MKDTFIDIHSHIIPGVDDGSESMEETMNMMEQAYSEGIRVMIATPHYGVINHRYSDNKALSIFNEVVKGVKKVYPEMKLLMGNEIYYSTGIANDILDGKARCLGDSTYALIEFNPSVEYDIIRQAIEEFTFNGFTPVIAHLERYECLNNDIKAVRTLVESGAYVQINCNSIIRRGLVPDKREKWCKKLLKENLVHFIASDCHNLGKRKPVFREAVQAVIRYIGEEKAEKIITGNALNLIENKKID